MSGVCNVNPQLETIAGLDDKCSPTEEIVHGGGVPGGFMQTAITQIFPTVIKCIYHPEGAVGSLPFRPRQLTPELRFCFH